MRRLLTAAAVALAAGCGGGGVAPVSGTVTLDGKPLAHATVTFEPAGGGKEPGPGSAGTTDAAGRYVLALNTTGGPGAVVGPHRVRVTAYAGDADGDSSAPPTSGTVHRKPLVPAAYNTQSTLTFEVPAGGSSAADFALKSATGPGKKGG